MTLVCVLAVTACAGAPGVGGGASAPIVRGGASVPLGSTSDQKVGRPYQVAGVWYVPTREDNYDEVGVASWYGPGFHGRRTANGEVFDENVVSAAHTTLPIPSYVEVSNLENGRRIIARLNDRGPFVDDRIIDLSREGARELGYENQGTARVRVRYLGPAGPTGAQPPRVTQVSTGPAPQVRAQAADLFAPDPAPARRRGGEGHDALFVQVASFRERDRAEALVRQLGEGGPVFIERARVQGHTWHRVMIGPWRDASGAEQARRGVARLGFGDARIVHGK